MLGESCEAAMNIRSQNAKVPNEVNLALDEPD